MPARLEDQLTGAIEQRILNSSLLDYTLQRFQAGLENKLAEMQRRTTGLDELRRERQSLKAKADRVPGGSDASSAGGIAGLRGVPTHSSSSLHSSSPY